LNYKINEEKKIELGIVIAFAKVNENGEVIVRFPMGDNETAQQLMSIIVEKKNGLKLNP
jgi:hypothetical protein